MKSRINRFAAILVAMMAWSSSASAACTNAEFAGTWEVFFSDGNSCKLDVNKQGEVLTAADRSQSTCLDPFRGVTVPDSGTVSVDKECLASFDLVVEGLEIQIFARIAQPRNVAAGFYVIFLSSDPWVEKGAINLIRVK